MVNVQKLKFTSLDRELKPIRASSSIVAGIGSLLDLFPSAPAPIRIPEIDHLTELFDIHELPKLNKSQDCWEAVGCAFEDASSHIAKAYESKVSSAKK